MKLIISSREEWESRNSDFRLTWEITVRRVQTETVTGQRLLACAGRNSPRHRWLFPRLCWHCRNWQEKPQHWRCRVRMPHAAADNSGDGAVWRRLAGHPSARYRCSPARRHWPGCPAVRGQAPANGPVNWSRLCWCSRRSGCGWRASLYWRRGTPPHPVPAWLCFTVSLLQRFCRKFRQKSAWIPEKCVQMKYRVRCTAANSVFGSGLGLPRSH